LRRRPAFRPVSSKNDFGWLWAAYQKGAFPKITEGLTAREFLETMAVLIANIDSCDLLFAPTYRGTIPVGMVAAELTDHRMNPEFIFFPWASARNKLESIVNYVNEFRRGFLIMQASPEEEWRFYTHLAKYGILHRVGKVPDYYSLDEPMMLFVSKR
jgi:hypothetical protein